MPQRNYFLCGIFCIDINDKLNYNGFMKTYLFVVNGLGIGDLPDCSAYNAKGRNTLDETLRGVPLPSLKLLGLYNIFGVSETQNPDVMATYARGRMLTNKIGLEHGMVEILGNIFHFEGSEERYIPENIISRLHSSGVKSYCIGSGKTFSTDYLSKNDIDVMQHITNSEVDSEVSNDDEKMDYIANIQEKDALVIAEFSDFCDSVLDEDKFGAISAMINFDSWVGVVMDAMEDDDLLIVTGNHGVNMREKTLTREYVPIMIFMRKCPIARDLGTEQGLNSIAYTISDIMGVYKSDKAMMSPLIVSSHTVEVSLAKIRNLVATSLGERTKNVKATMDKVKNGINAISFRKDEKKEPKKIKIKQPNVKTLTAKE